MVVLWMLLLFCQNSISQNVTDGQAGTGTDPSAHVDNLDGSLTGQSTPSLQSSVSSQSSNQSDLSSQTTAASNQSDLSTQMSAANNQSDVSTQTSVASSQSGVLLQTSAPNKQSDVSTQPTSLSENHTEIIEQNGTDTVITEKASEEWNVTTPHTAEDVTDGTTEGVNKTRTEALPTTTQSHPTDTMWMETFLSIHHFDGWYTYGNGKFIFDFVAQFVHPKDSWTLVATFYDEDGAIFDMNGTSNDGHTVTFTSTKLYTESYRFMKDTVLQINGSFINQGDNSVYSGSITLPINSSFQQFFMVKGLERRDSVDQRTSKMAAIIAVICCISFLFILGATSLICWAMKRGYLRKHKSYQLFGESSVAFEADAETVHI